MALSPTVPHGIADSLEQQAHIFSRDPQNFPDVVVGFDGFTDEILDVVDSRQDSSTYTTLPTIASLGERLVAAAGSSCNIELVPKQLKLGGNAPIMANALVEAGQQVTFIGAIGSPDVEDVFSGLAQRCKSVISLCPSSHTDALEFSDGKVLLGKLATLDAITYKSLLEAVFLQDLIALLNKATLFASVNWTMLPNMTELWRGIVEEIIPNLEPSSSRYLFVDLADPRKRSDDSLVEAMDVLRQFSPAYQVILGLNSAEAQRLGRVLRVSGATDCHNPDGQGQLAEHLRAKTGFSQILLHQRHHATVATEEGTWTHPTAYCEKPRLCTGAGDNFNAGYCAGILHHLPPDEAVVCGNAMAGYYVRNAASPTLNQLIDFLRQWPVEALSR